MVETCMYNNYRRNFKTNPTVERVQFAFMVDGRYLVDGKYLSISLDILYSNF